MKKRSAQALRGGSYSLFLTALVLAILIMVNIAVSALPDTITKLDISSAKLYSITGNTRVVVNALEKDVTIYWIVQSDEEDEIIENLLGKYEALSSHIQVVKKNPDVFPTFAQQYTDEYVYNNSLVVECGERSRYIAYDDIYVQESSLYSYSYSTSFDGEGAITSAIDYVISEELPKVYTLSGHGESDLPETFLDKIEKENLELESLSLLTVDEIPEDAACLLIYAPESDISQEEADMLSSYVAQGGKLLVMAGPVDGCNLETLYSLLSDYGVTAQEGIVIEAEREHYAFQRPYILLPDMQSNAVTDSLIEEGYSCLMPLSTGFTVSGNSYVTELLTTSESAFSKLSGYALETYEKEDGDIDGSFALAVSIENNNGGEMIWFGSSAFLEDLYNAYSSGANADLAMNALSTLIGERESVAIRSKSLNYNYLTISETQGAALKAVMLLILPLGYLLYGIFTVLDVRRKQNETLG